MGNSNSSRQYTYQQYYKAVIKKDVNFDFSKIGLKLVMRHSTYIHLFYFYLPQDILINDALLVLGRFTKK